MEKLDIIHEALGLLPDELRYGTIKANGTEMPLEEYLENYFVKAINETATPKNVADLIKNKLGTFIKPGLSKQDKINYVQNFIDGLDGFTETIYLGNGEYMDVRERLTTIVVENMDNDYMISVGPRKESLEEHYRKILMNNQPILTLADKEEICRSCIGNIEIAVLESKMEEYDGNVKEYITEFLPTVMVSVDQVEFGGTTLYLPEVIDKIVLRQKEIIAEEERKENGIPNQLGEIIVGKDNKVGYDAPVKPLEPASDKELDYLVKLYADKLTLSEDEISVDMNRLMDMIRNSSSKEGYETVKKEVEEYIQGLNTMALPTYLRVKLNTINQMLEKKNIIITKQQHLLEEVGDHSYNVANMVKSEAKEKGTQDAYNLAIGRILSMKKDMSQIDYSDYQVEAHIQGIEDELRSGMIKSGSIKTNESTEKAVLKSTIEVEYINKFEREVQNAISYGGAAHIEGAMLRLEKDYENYLIFLKDLKTQKRLSNEEYEYFKTQLSTSLKKLYGSLYINYEKKESTQQIPVVMEDDGSLLGLDEEENTNTMKM